MICMLIFKNYTLLVVTIYLLVLSLLSFSKFESIDVYGISHDKKLPREFPSFTDNVKSDQNLKGNINKNSSIPENSK